MKTNYIPAIVTFLAGVITCILCILSGYEVTDMLVMLLLTLIIFYFVGTLARYALHKIMAQTSEIEDDYNDLDEYKGVNEVDVNDEGVLVVSREAQKEGQENDDEDDDWS